MAKIIGYTIALAFGLIVGASILFVVGETIETVTYYHDTQHR